MKKYTIRLFAFTLLLLLLIIDLERGSAQDKGKEFSQRILLDKPVDAGDLKLFRSFSIKGESNEYSYLPNKISIA